MGLKNEVGPFERQCLSCYIEKAAVQECISTGGGVEQLEEGAMCLPAPRDR